MRRVHAQNTSEKQTLKETEKKQKSRGPVKTMRRLLPSGRELLVNFLVVLMLSQMNLYVVASIRRTDEEQKRADAVRWRNLRDARAGATNSNHRPIVETPDPNEGSTRWNDASASSYFGVDKRLASLLPEQVKEFFSETNNRLLGLIYPSGEAKSAAQTDSSAGRIPGFNSRPMPPVSIVDAAVSRRRPSLNGGTINGSLRVFSGESYTFNSPFHLNGDLYTVGTPNVTVNTGASHGGIINDGGNAAPTGYGITFNSGAILPGKIHIRADALPLPADIPSSVPSPSGTRYVNINSPSDVNSIGNWATLRSLNVGPSNLTINVPPGNYDTFSMNGGNIKLVFSAGTYNFSGAINLNNGSKVESNGQVTINIGQGLNVNNGSYLLGAGTAASDVRLNVVGSSLTVDNGSQINALVRAVNANVNINNGTVRGQLIANYLNINSGQIIGDANPADTTAPTLAVASPADNSTTQAETVNLSGTVADAGAPSSGVASVTVNGAAAVYNAAAGTWSFNNFGLALGNNVLTVRAVDAAGNQTTKTVTVIRQNPPDTTPPVLTITSPQNQFSTYAAQVTVTGTAVDQGVSAGGVSRVVVNGVEAILQPNGNWTASVPLSDGPNAIVATAFDSAAPPNQSQQQIQVLRIRTDAPNLIINSPVNGSFTSNSAATVAGAVSSNNPDLTIQVSVNGQNAPVGGGQFAATVNLAGGVNTITVTATDSEGRASERSLTVTNDNVPPSVVLTNVPQVIQAGTNYQLAAEAADLIGVAGVVFTIDGEIVSADNSAPYEFNLSVPADTPAGKIINISAVARDLAGTTATDTKQTIVSGPAGISGYVFDDTTGYTIGGATARYGANESVNTSEEGVYGFVTSAPSGVVRISRDGYTPVERFFNGAAGLGTELFDARLTPQDSRSNPTDSQGAATAASADGNVSIQLPAGSFPANTDVRVTPVSPQGLLNLLPYGWSPVPGAVFDVRPFNSSAIPATYDFPAAGRLTIQNIADLTSAPTLVLARYDESARSWIITARDVAAVDGRVTADIFKSGQYAFLIADTGATAPPAANVGQIVPSSAPADSAALDAATASAVSSPLTALFSSQARSTISFVANSPTKLPSGVSIESSFDETYIPLADRTPVNVSRPAQDFVLYSFGASTEGEPNKLGAFFVAKPTDTGYSVSNLLRANIHVEIRSGRLAQVGVLIGSGGGVVRGEDGSQLEIPAGASTQSQSVFFTRVPAEQAGVSLPENYEMMAAFDVNLTGGELAQAASISFPTFAGDNSRIVLARVLTAGGARGLKIAARGVESNGRIVSTVGAPAVPNGVALPGVASSGRYVFIRVPVAFGYVKGIVKAGSAPAADVRLLSDKTPFIDITKADGKYTLLGTAGAAPAGSNQIFASALRNDSTGQGAAALSGQDAVADVPVTLGTAPLQIVSVTPAANAGNVVISSPITVNFNKPVNPASVTGSSLKLTTVAGNPVIGSIIVLAGGRSAVFTPNASLTGSTDYKILVTSAVRDIYGNALSGSFESVFRTANAVAAENRLRPELIRVNYPDENGVSTIRIPAGAVPAGSVIVAINQASGSTITVVVGTEEIVLSLLAEVGDEIMIIIRQPDGTEYTVTQSAYRRPDGFTTVGAGGGNVVADDGQTVMTIPRGAIEGQANIKMTPKGEETIVLPRAGEMNPANVPFGGGVEIRTEGTFTVKKEIHIEIPAPAGVAEGQRAAFMKPSQTTVNGQPVDFWEVLTSGRVENGKIKSTSPPFLGIFAVGVFVVYAFMPVNLRVIYGHVKAIDAQGNPTQPVANVLCMLDEGETGVYGKPMGRTNADGRFSFFDLRLSNPGFAQIKAYDDSLNRVGFGTAVSPNSIPTDFITGLLGFSTLTTDISLPRFQGGENADLTPPVLHPYVVVPGEPFEPGQSRPEGINRSVGVGTGTKIYVTTDKPIESITGKVLVGGINETNLVWKKVTSFPPGMITTSTGQVWETEQVVSAETTYNVSITAFKLAGVPATKAVKNGIMVGVRQGSTRGNIPNVAPTVLSTTPREGADGVDPTAYINIEFSEPVQNLVGGQTVYLQEDGRPEKIGGRIATLDDTTVSYNTPDVFLVRFIPDRELSGGKRYSLHVTTGVKDWDTDANGPRSLDYEQNAEHPGNQECVVSFKVFSGTIINDQPLPDRSTRIAVADDFAATLLGERLRSTVTLYDISNPQQPVQQGFVNIPQRAWDIDFKNLGNSSIVVQGDVYSRIIAVVSSNPLEQQQYANVWFISADDPTRMRVVGVASLFLPSEAPSSPLTVRIHEGRAYIGNAPWRGVMAVEIGTAIAAYKGARAQGIFPEVYAVMQGAGFGQVAKRQTVEIGPNQPNGAVIYGNSSVTSLDILRQTVNRPQSPTGDMPVVFAANNNGKRLAVIGFPASTDTSNHQSGGISLNDIRMLHLGGVVPADNAPQHVRVADNARCGANNARCDMALVLGNSRLWIYNVNDPVNPSLFPSKSFAELGITGFARYFVVEENFAYLIVDNDVVVIDFSDPANPRVVARVAGVGANLSGLAVKNGFIYSLSPNADGTGGLNVSVARASSQVYIYGVTAGSELRCANPVVIDRTENRMKQEAEIFFQIFGRTTRPVSQRVVIRKNDTEIGQVDAALAPTTTDRLTIGTARWMSDQPIDRSALYTAEVILDEGAPTEYHSQRETVPFSHLIESYSTQVQAIKSFSQPTKSTYGYVLGGNGSVTFKINSASPLVPIDNQGRVFGLNVEQVDLGGLQKGRYPFELRAALSGSDYTETVIGTLSINDDAQSVRVPGQMVVNGANVANGNYGISQTDVPEIKNRGLSLSFTRSYNSLTADSFNTFGYGWSHNYQVLLGVRQTPGGFTYHLSGGDGNTQTFLATTERGLLTMKAEAPNQGTLVRNLNGSLDFFTKENIRYHFDGALKMDSFDYYERSYVGNVAYIEEPHGNKLTFFYNTRGVVTKVTDSAERAIEFEYESTTHPFAGLIAPTDAVFLADACITRNNINQLRNRFLRAQVGEAWRIKGLTAPGGLKINYEYDAKGNLKKVTKIGQDEIGSAAAENQVWSYAYNPSPNGSQTYEHLLKSATEPNEAGGVSRTTNYKYYLFEQGLPGIFIKEINQPEGVTHAFSYVAAPNGLVQKTTATDGNGGDTVYELNATGNVETMTAPREAVTRMTWTNFGQIDTETDPQGKITDIDYDAQNNPVRKTVTGVDGKKIVTETKYDAKFSKLAESTDGNGHTTFYRINSATGDVFRVDLPTGRSISVNYEGNGDIKDIKNEFGVVTEYKNYDGFGNPQTVKRQISSDLFSTTTNTFDGRSRLKTMRDDVQPSATLRYDAFDRLVSQTLEDPANIRDPQTNTFTYFPEGQQKSVTMSGQGQNRSVVNEYDGMNRLTKATETVSGAGEMGGDGTFVRRFSYDFNSNVLTADDRRGVTTVKSYDELNFVTQVTLQKAAESKIVWKALETDKVGNAKRVVDHFGFETKFVYDGLYRLEKKTLPVTGCGAGACEASYTYDGNNNVRTFTDANGRTTERLYDPVDRLEEERKPLGHTVKWKYIDAENTIRREEILRNLTEEKKSDGLNRPIFEKTTFQTGVGAQGQAQTASYTTEYVYDGRTVTTIDPRGTRTTTKLSAFGDRGNIEVDGANPGYAVEIKYSSFGAARYLKNANGDETSIINNGFNRPVLASLPESATEKWRYDGGGMLVEHRDRRGAVSVLEYDVLGRRTSHRVNEVINQGAAETVEVEKIAYDDINRRETRTDALDRASVYDFDGLHRVVKMTNAKGRSREFRYDGVNLREESDFKNQSTHYTYDALDRVREIRDRTQNQRTFVNYEDSYVTTRTTTDRRGYQTRETYDAKGRLLEIVDGISAGSGGERKIAYAYDGNSNRTSRTDGRGHTTSYVYDKLNRVSTVTHPNNLQIESFTYDSVGNVLSYADGRGGTIVSTYDKLNNLKTRSDGAGNVTNFKFDAEGLLTEKTEPKGAGHKSTYTYNNLRSLIGIVDADSKPWTLRYDKAQNLKSTSNPLGRTTAYDYDAVNNLERVTQMNGIVTTYGYDDNSNRTRMTDPKGQVTQYTYDALDRVDVVTSNGLEGSDARQTDIDYDGEGNPTEIRDKVKYGSSIEALRRHTRVYDGRGRLKSAKDGYGKTVSFEYDATDNLTRITDAVQKQTKYDYDALGRLQTATLDFGSASQKTVGYQWYSDGLIKQVDYTAGAKRSYAYDDADRVTSITNTYAGSQSESFDYTYDANSNRDTETRKINGQIARSVFYGYDNLDRLKSARYETPGQTLAVNQFNWTYDAVGNRKTQTGNNFNGSTLDQDYTYDENDRLTGVTDNGINRTFEYDANGNLKKEKENGILTRTYDYDARDQLTKFEAIGTNVSTSYEYDFERRRTSRRSSSGGELTYTYAGSDVVNEFDGQNALVGRYDMAGEGELIRSELAGEGERFHFSDALGSNTSTASGSGAFAVRTEYGAFGDVIGASGASTNAIGYTGQRRDAESGLMALGNGERYYAPGLGRFVQQDSWTGAAGMPQTLNRYAYALNNPVIHSDPSGNIPPAILAVLIIGAIGGAVAGGIIGASYSYDRQMAEIADGTRGMHEFSRMDVFTSGLKGAFWGAVTGVAGAATIAYTLPVAAATLVAGGAVLSGVQIYQGYVERSLGHKNVGNIDMAYGVLGLILSVTGAKATRSAFKNKAAPKTVEETEPLKLGDGGAQERINSGRLLKAKTDEMVEPKNQTRFVGQEEGPSQDVSTGRGNPNTAAAKKGPFEIETTIDNIRVGVEEVLQENLAAIKEVVPPDAKIGYRGSLARGRKGEHKNYDPFEPMKFDVDAFIISNKLAAKTGIVKGPRWSNDLPQLLAINKSIHQKIKALFPGLKDKKKDRFQFRIFTEEEAQQWNLTKDPIKLIEEGGNK